MTTPIALIIEDDPTLATVFAKALQAARYETEILTDGQMAQERLAQTSPDMVILDLHLPNVSGKDILAQIQTADHLAETRVIITSADSALADYFRDQVDLVLEKPVSFHQLRTLSARLHPDHDAGS